MGNVRLLVLLCLLTAILEVPGVTSSSSASSIPDHEDLIPEESSYSIKRSVSSTRRHRSPKVVAVHSPNKTKSQPHHHKGWTTAAPKKEMETTTKAPYRPYCQEIKDLNISEPKDIPKGYVLVNTDRQIVDPFVVLSPPLNLTPLPPPQIKATDLPSRQVEVVFIERLSISVDDSLRAAGTSLITSSVFQTQNVTEDQLLPFPGNSTASNSVMTVETRIVSYGKPTAPLNGMASEKVFFTNGLKVAEQQRELGLTQSPLENFLQTDLNLMTSLFQEIWQFELRIPAETEEDEETRLEMPIIVNRKEKKSIPEPNSSERTILDAEFNFGLPASYVDFESFEPTLESWKEMRDTKKESGEVAVSPQDFSRNYRGMSEFYESLQEFVMTRTKSLERFGSSSFQDTDTLAQDVYKVDQFLICRQGTMRNKPDCEMCILDPVKAPFMMTDFRAGSGSSMGRPKPSRPRRNPSGGFRSGET